MKLVKHFGALLFAVIVTFLYALNFSVKLSNFECTGKILSSENTEPITVYIILEEYRWWVGLWSDSDGNVKLEIPNKTVDYYSHVIKVGSQLQIYNKPSEMKGNFSMLSKVLSLKTPIGFFDGKCVGIN